jgi:acyl-ACP thioesterase
MSADGAVGWDGPPEGWRAYRASRRVRLADVTPTREIRLDAVARYLQDVAADDVRDAGLEGLAAWVVRRTELRVTARPAYGDHIDLVTWCAGTGAAWAQRRTTLSAGGPPLVEASSLWVSLDPRSMRPCPLDDRFFAAYGEGPRSRPVKARLRLPAEPPAGAPRGTWPLRRSDFDLLGHVNNAVAWAAVEEDAYRVDPDRRIGEADLEYRGPIDGDGALAVVAAGDDSGRGVWLLDDTGQSAVVATVTLAERWA